MMTTGILPVPGTEQKFVKNGFDFEIDFSWFPIVSTCLSVIGILFGAKWIVKPVEKETNSIIGKFTFIPIFFFRMLVWLLILTILNSFSVIAFVCFAASNWMILLCAQDNLDIDPVNHSVMSLIFPVSKLPSSKLDSKFSMKLLFWMVLKGNSMLLLFYITLFCLYNFNLYNPWTRYNNRLLIAEEVFGNCIAMVIALFVAATLPICLANCIHFKR